MTIHSTEEMVDGRKRVRGKVIKNKTPRVDFPAMNLDTVLGADVRTWLWADVENLVEQHGGWACGWTRNFFEQHITQEVCATFVDRRFPGLIEKGNALLMKIKGRKLSPSERVEFKAYRYIWGGCHDQTKDSPEERFGPGKGKRYWKNNSVLSNNMLKVQNMLTTHGPLVSFNFDIEQPNVAPVMRTK